MPIARVAALQPLIVILGHCGVRLEGTLRADTCTVYLVLPLASSQGVFVKMVRCLMMPPILLLVVLTLPLLNDTVTLITRVELLPLEDLL